MMDVKGKFLKKMKSIKPIGYLKQETMLKVQALDGFIGALPKNLVNQLRVKALMPPREPDSKRNGQGNAVMVNEPEAIDVAELMRDLEEEDQYMEDDEFNDKENAGPCDKEGFEKRKLSNTSRSKPLGESNGGSFRRPDLDSSCLFDPNLLEAFQTAVQEQAKINEETRQARLELREKCVLVKNDADSRELTEGERPLKSRKVEEEKSEAESEEAEVNPLSCFEERCPPGGSDTVILYTTSLRGIRKTFEDCSSIRFLLESFKILFFERDVSMHMEFKEEVRKIMEGKISIPILFIRGRFIGGAEEVLRLHESGKFKELFQGISLDHSTSPCESCSGFRFIVCFSCNGSHRAISDDGSSSPCHSCNENGLVICPLCC